MRIRDQLVSPENLAWAWQKARRLYQGADGPIDIAEVAAFELDLENQLAKIGSDFQNLTYRPRPLTLLPQPKKPDENGNPRLRQSFHVDVRDQVAWIALTNVVGPILDSQMPAWSYGHRLYKAAWFEEQSDGASLLKLGPYRHSSGALYRKFKHSWPLFRRHISLTARLMVSALKDDDQLDSSEKSALNYADRPKYLTKQYWPTTDSNYLYYASIDLEQFYPKISKPAVLRGFEKYLPDYQGDQWVRTLISRMLTFTIKEAGSCLLGDEVVQPTTYKGSFEGIPTGLMVAGFLSNVAMLPLDAWTERQISKSKRIAQFRFVDDHAILAYDFEELRAWIRKYERALARLGIGPVISETKFDPKSMAEARKRSADPSIVAESAAASKIDGSHPSRLMTKTLALVSELAGADFDILSEDSRGQRLRELEWLLLADLPDREIRADTRAAFAAGRIASLVPIATGPSIELLKAWREVARLKLVPASKLAKIEGVDELEIAKSQVKVHEIIDRNKFMRNVDHYFKLVIQAFYEHPDKPRLFLRVLDYCRVTGHSGTSEILRWLASEGDGAHATLAEYLRPLAIQAIAKHIATAVVDSTDPRLLNRQKRAAGRYLRHMTHAGVRPLLVKLVLMGKGGKASDAARSNFYAACAAATDAVGSQARRPILHARFNALMREVGAPQLTAASSTWVRKTGSSIGVWVHWLDATMGHRGLEPGPNWYRTAAKHDPDLKSDWQSLRKGADVLPNSQGEYALSDGVRKLTKGDAGWLLDLTSSSFSPHPLESTPRTRVVTQLIHHLRSNGLRSDYVSGVEWIAQLREIKAANGHDPRASEWTALEVLRQLLAQIRAFPGMSIGILDELHPSNILIPRRWLAAGPVDVSQDARWTWDSWRYAAANGARQVGVSDRPIDDYRRQLPAMAGADDAEELWQQRLRGCGFLLLGLLARDFRLPADWNVRGVERDTASFVRGALEEIPVSSHTHAIIEAALLPRSAETALMRRNPWAFFGQRLVTAINDTTSDPPLIHNVDALWDAIELAQSTLQRRQISVLNHAPRQLIPMNVVQLTGSAVEVVDADIEE
ncbi:hypothetical protein [Caulobacter segnis]